MLHYNKGTPQIAKFCCSDCKSTETQHFTPDCCSYCGGLVVERVQTIVAASTKSDKYETLIARKVKLHRIISDLTETMQGSFLPPDVAMELTGRRSSARMKLNSVEIAISKELGLEP